MSELTFWDQLTLGITFAIIAIYTWRRLKRIFGHTQGKCDGCSGGCSSFSSSGSCNVASEKPVDSSAITKR